MLSSIATLPPKAIQESVKGLLKDVLEDQFRIPRSQIRVERLRSSSNSHLFAITLHLVHPFTKPAMAREASLMPFTTPIPVGTTQLVFRVPKTEASYAIKHMIAGYAVARDALKEKKYLVPEVYAWRDSPTNRWVLERHMGGHTVTVEELATDEDRIRPLLHQLADVAKRFLEYELPPKLRKFGGVTFDSNNVLTAAPLVHGGPFATHQEFIKAKCRWRLDVSEKVRRIKGWRDSPELRKRIDRFLDEGIDKVLGELPNCKPILVHSSLTKLVIVDGNSLLGILGFDHVFLSSPISQHMAFFTNTYENTRDTGRKLHNETFSNIWSESLVDIGMTRPQDIEGADLLGHVWLFVRHICPDDLGDGQWLEAHEAKELRDKAEARLDAHLTRWGY